MEYEYIEMLGGRAVGVLSVWQTRPAGPRLVGLGCLLGQVSRPASFHLAFPCPAPGLSTITPHLSLAGVVILVGDLARWLRPSTPTTPYCA